jgi:hypothetical protein
MFAGRMDHPNLREGSALVFGRSGRAFARTATMIRVDDNKTSIVHLGQEPCAYGLPIRVEILSYP